MGFTSTEKLLLALNLLAMSAVCSAMELPALLQTLTIKDNPPTLQGGRRVRLEPGVHAYRSAMVVTHPDATRYGRTIEKIIDDETLEAAYLFTRTTDYQFYTVITAADNKPVGSITLDLKAGCIDTTALPQKFLCTPEFAETIFNLMHHMFDSQPHLSACSLKVVIIDDFHSKDRKSDDACCLTLPSVCFEEKPGKLTIEFGPTEKCGESVVYEIGGVKCTFDKVPCVYRESQLVCQREAWLKETEK